VAPAAVSDGSERVAEPGRQNRTLEASKASKEVDQPAKYAARAATLTASVAYSLMDLQRSIQVVRQARHVLGPAIYAALALGTEAGGDPQFATMNCIVQLRVPRLRFAIF
jgi:hypothetical protein